jgi:hypothetical protein
MKIPTEQILDFVTGSSSLAALAEAHRELPDVVDADRDARPLSRLGSTQMSRSGTSTKSSRQPAVCKGVLQKKHVVTAGNEVQDRRKESRC